MSQATPTAAPSQHAPPLDDASQLAIALSHYELGVIEQLPPLPLGDPSSMKRLVRCEHGLFLLKRRKERRDELERVQFTQRVHATLTDSGFPAPALVGTKRSGKPCVAVGDRVFELVRWVPGERFGGTTGQTEGAGAALALLHRTLSGFSPLPSVASVPSPHAAPSVIGHLTGIESALPGCKETARELATLYSAAGHAVTDAGWSSWPEQVIHGDWHPGNLLFNDHAVVAVIDFDNARVGTRAYDIASGALQFALTRGSADVNSWPDSLDSTRFAAFCRGYEGQLSDPLSSAEVGALPWLMIESLIAEAAGPVAATGTFAGINGDEFLRMIARKAGWIRDHASDLVRSLG